MPKRRKGASLDRQTRTAASMRNRRAQRTEKQQQQDNDNARESMALLHQAESGDARAERNEQRRLEQRQARRYIVNRRRANDQQRQQMGGRCCVSGCSSNCGSQPYIASFTFPKEVVRKELWLKNVNRADFEPTKSSVVCIHHFEEKFVIREDRVTRDNGSILIVPRNKLALTKDAYPTIFPNQSSVSACKTRWRTIRDSYKKTKNKIQMKSKNGLTPFSKSKYTNENLKFLDESFKERTTYAAQLKKYNWTPEDSNSQEYLKVDEAPNIMLHPQIKLEIIESDENQADCLPSRAEDNSPAEENDSESGNNSLLVNESYILGPSCDVPSATETKPQRKRTIGGISKEAKRRREDQLEESSVSQADLTPVAEDVIDDSEHPIQTFFRSMANTAMSFPPHLIVEARMRVNEIISELELRSMSEENILEYSLSFQPQNTVASPSVASVITRVTCVPKVTIVPSTEILPNSSST